MEIKKFFCADCGKVLPLGELTSTMDGLLCDRCYQIARRIFLQELREENKSDD
jgi:DNA-directed RNA polymerase subunit RPC12/RpoP